MMGMETVQSTIQVNGSPETVTDLNQWVAYPPTTQPVSCPIDEKTWETGQPPWIDLGNLLPGHELSGSIKLTHGFITPDDYGTWDITLTYSSLWHFFGK